GFEPVNNGFADRRLSHLAMPPRSRNGNDLAAYRQAIRGYSLRHLLRSALDYSTRALLPAPRGRLRDNISWRFFFPHSLPPTRKALSYALPIKALHLSPCHWLSGDGEVRVNDQRAVRQVNHGSIRCGTALERKPLGPRFDHDLSFAAQKEIKYAWQI